DDVRTVRTERNPNSHLSHGLNDPFLHAECLPGLCRIVLADATGKLQSRCLGNWPLREEEEPRLSSRLSNRSVRGGSADVGRNLNPESISEALDPASATAHRTVESSLGIVETTA